MDALVTPQLHWFGLINAPPGLHGMRLAACIALAEYLILLLPLVMVVAWLRGDAADRRELLHLSCATLIALGLAQCVGWLWPEPRPFALHLGRQYLAHADAPGLPSDHVTVFWSLALAAFGTRRWAAAAFPLLALGLAVGWSRVYLGVHFPLDVLAALPVAACGNAVAEVLRPAAERVAYRPAVAAWSRWTRPRRASPQSNGSD